MHVAVGHRLVVDLFSLLVAEVAAIHPVQTGKVSPARNSWPPDSAISSAARIGTVQSLPMARTNWASAPGNR